MSVWQRHRNWWSEVLWKPKKQLSIDQLKYQQQVLQRNPHITENNKQTIVETFRAIAEILIWGDQNDSRVFDFFLEKNMQSYFLKILTQRCGRYVCLQLLQTLNILFENIRNETSIYYLLSNNHVNSIIVLKLDFSDEEVLAYYISFLKTLSFKLNKHTIHFFYNEHLRDFPLYTEAIKFFNHSESMVRIAVRTLTLNVYKVNDPAMLEYIHNKTAVPYFSNLVWFIGNHVIELDECLISQAHHLNRGRLEQLVAEHLDHLHYISDILSLKVQSLNDVIIDHLLNRLLIPLYVYSLTDQALDSEEVQRSQGDSPRISTTISLFMLSQVFLILKCPEVVTPLAYLILTGDTTLILPPTLQATPPTCHRRDGSYTGVRGFVRPEASLESSLAPKANENKVKSRSNPVNLDRIRISEDSGGSSQEGSSTESQRHMTEASVGRAEASRFTETRPRSNSSLGDFVDVSIVDSQYVLIEPSSDGSHTSSLMESMSEAQPTLSPSHTHSEAKTHKVPVGNEQPPTSESPKPKSSCASLKRTSPRHSIPVTSTVFLDVLMNALSVRNDDSRCLFTLCLLLAMIQNEGVHPKLLEAFSLKPLPPEESGVPQYNSELVILLLSTLDTSTAPSSCVRLVTLRLATMLLKNLLGTSTTSPLLQDHHIALIENIYESSILRLRLYYKGSHDEFFLDMFEDQFTNERLFEVKIPYLMMDASMLLPPTDTPLTGIDFTRRLPCGENEKAMNAMRVFFAIRRLSQQLQNLEECELPLTPPTNSAKPGDILDFNNCNLVCCNVLAGEKKSQHFMVVTETEFLLVNPDKAKLGWGVVHFICFLQDVDVTTDPADSCSLYVVCSRDSAQKRPALSARFQFDDYIRCVSARQLLLRSKDNLRLAKMTRITKMLHLPLPEASPTSSVAALPQPQTDGHHNLGVISISPTPNTLGCPPSQPVELTSSVLNKVFLPPSATPLNSQEIEMSNFQFSRPSHLQHSLAEADAPVVFESPVKLAPPISPPTENYSSESSCKDSLDASLTDVHIGEDSLLVRYEHSGKSHTPETLLDQSFGSHTDELSSELSTSTEQADTLSRPADGYRVELLRGEDVGNHGDTPTGYDSSMAEEDRGFHLRPGVSNQQTGDSREHDGSGCIEPVREQNMASNSELATVEHPLANKEHAPGKLEHAPRQLHQCTDRDDAPRQFLPSSSFLSNGKPVAHHIASVSISEDTPVTVEQLPALPSGAGPPMAVNELDVSSNIIWDVPLIEEINIERSRTVSSPFTSSPGQRHRSHDYM